MGIRIRPWDLRDADDLALALNNKRIHDNLRDGLPLPYTASDAGHFISAMLSAPENSLYAFAIDLNGRAVGSIGLFRKENIHARTAELGYYVAEPYWGRGFATDAVKLACVYAFDNTDLIRIFAEPFARNWASCRVLEKAGFVLEGLLRKNAVKNGEIQDMKLYARVRE